MVALYAVEAPENWFEDFGSGQLANGSATVALETTYAQTVNTHIEYHVFLTPKGDCDGLLPAKHATGVPAPADNVLRFSPKVQLRFSRLPATCRPRNGSVDFAGRNRTSRFHAAKPSATV
jgi:hypothetical protein